MGASKPKLEDFKEFEDDIDLKSLFKNVVLFDEFPVIDDIVLTYRNYRWIMPYVKFLLAYDENDEGKGFHEFLGKYGMPGADAFSRRIVENTTDKEIKELALKHQSLLEIWDDLHKIETKKKFFVESGLGSLQNRVNLAMPITLKLFKMELKRLGWDLVNASDKELISKFKVLLYEYKNDDGTYDEVFILNLKTLKEMIQLTKD